MYTILFLGITGLVLSLGLTPLVRNIFRTLGVVDYPDSERKLHSRPIPRVGGIAVALAYSLAFAALLFVKQQSGYAVRPFAPLVWQLLPAAILIFLVGLLDDIIGLRPWQKLLGQIAAAVIAYFAGIRVVAVGHEHLTSAFWSFPASVIWLVACTNAVNLIDGIDGLAAGVGFVATTTMMLAAGIQHNAELLVVTVPLAAALLGFLRYNFNPATIFLGDCGSLFIGFLLGCYGVIWAQKSATVLGMTAPLMALAIPLLDASLAIIRRFLRNQPIFHADRGHIHHRLLDRGLTPRRVVLLLYGFCGLAAVFSLFVTNHHLELPVVLVFCVTLWISIQRLGFVEFGTVGRMLMEGSFRRLLNSRISLQTLESALSRSNSPDECWLTVRNSCEEFGFCQVELQLAGRIFSDVCAHGANPTWRLEMSLAGDDYLHLVREINGEFKYETIGLFVEVLRRALEAKGPLFAFSEVETADLESFKTFVASAGN